LGSLLLPIRIAIPRNIHRRRWNRQEERARSSQGTE
jgi:hypothetical protein